MQPTKGTTPTRTWLDQLIDAATAIGLLVLILVGFATSYRTLSGLAITVGGYPAWLAPAVPLSFDLGIVVLSLKVTRAAREGRFAPILRLMIAVLSVSTVLVNAAATPGTAARLLHAIPSVMFVVCFESVVAAARRRALAAMGLFPENLPRIRAANWLLAPLSTWQDWRQMVLTTGHATALGRATDKPVQHKVIDARPVVHQADNPIDDGRPIPPLATVGGTDRAARLNLAIGTLRHDPEMTAVELAQTLLDAGYDVSIRTAQRIRSQALANEWLGGAAVDPSTDSTTERSGPPASVT